MIVTVIEPLLSDNEDGGGVCSDCEAGEIVQDFSTLQVHVPIVTRDVPGANPRQQPHPRNA